jgi:hypothetical protein
VEAPSPSIGHQRVSRDLLTALHQYCQASGLAELFAASPLLPGFHVPLARLFARPGA